MTSGLTIFNNSNTVQIDESWQNYGFRQKISITITTSNIVGSGYPSQFRYSLVAPGTQALLCACRSPSQYPFRLHSYYSGGAWTIDWLFMHDDGDSGTYEPSTYTATIDFFIFDTLESSYSSVGLEVFNASGARVFHSDAPMMKIGAVQPCTSGFSWAAGRKYAPLIMQIPAGGIMVAGSGLRSAQYCVRCNTANINSKLYYNNVAGSLASSVGAGLYAAIDVTGLT